MDISRNGFNVDSFSMRLDGTKSKTTPALFEKLHLVITLSGDLDERAVADIIQETIMHICPVASMFGKLMEITWEHHIIENGSKANSNEIVV